MKFYGGIFILSLLGVLLVDVPMTSALHTNNYNISITDNVRIGGESENGKCDVADMTTRWAEFMSNDTNDRWSYKNTWNYIHNHNKARQKLDSFRQQFMNALATGSGWAVNMIDGTQMGTGTGNKGVRIILFRNDQNVKVVQYGLKAFPVYATLSSFFLNSNASCRFQAWEENVRRENISISPQNPLLFVNSSNIQYPADYIGEPLPSTPPGARKYVAMGDSFSSGEGVPPFEGGSENDCKRSPKSYPRLLTARLYLDMTNFAACAGATTFDVDGIGEDDQLNLVPDSTDIITITVGGNDVNFKEFATACTIHLCDFESDAYRNISEKIANELPTKLRSTYQAIDSKTASDVRVLVVGYPHLAPPTMPTGASSLCWPLNGGVNNADPSKNNGAAVRVVQTKLNNAINKAVIDYGSSKFQYIDPNHAGSPFEGHDWCKTDRYFVEVALNQTSYSYHPNAKGHAAYSEILAPIIGH